MAKVTKCACDLVGLPKDWILRFTFIENEIAVEILDNYNVVMRSFSDPLICIHEVISHAIEEAKKLEKEIEDRWNYNKR